MPDCDFTLRQKGGVRHRGDRFTISCIPPLPAGCTLTVYVDGQEVVPPARLGGLKVIGIGGSGTVDLEALDDAPAGVVSFEITCRGETPCGPTRREHRIQRDPPPVPVAACPCSVKVCWIRIKGYKLPIFELLARVNGLNPQHRELYHAALKVQLPEKNECPTYVIELVRYIDDTREAHEKGQVRAGDFDLPRWLEPLWPGRAYGIRRWRNGQIDGTVPGEPPAQCVEISTNCGVCANLLQLVLAAPVLPWGSTKYGLAWTSNSLVSWLLERAGVNAAQVPQPRDGVVLGWNDGIEGAQHPR